MPRGKQAPDGATYVAQNGYHYTKVDGKYKATHRIIVEKQLGRELHEHERIRFVDGDKTNLSPENLKIVTKGRSSLQTQLARLIARRDELDAQIILVRQEIAAQDNAARLKQLESQAQSS